MTEQKSQYTGRILHRKPLIVAIAVFVIVLVVAGGIIGYQKTYAGRFYPGVQIGHLSVGGKTTAEVLEALRQIERNIADKGLIFTYQDKQVAVLPVVVGVNDPDLAKTILAFEWTPTIEQALAVGRTGNWFQQLFEQLGALVRGAAEPVYYQFDAAEVVTILKENFSQLEQPAVDATLVIEAGEVSVTDERSGEGFDYQLAADQVAVKISQLNFEPTELHFAPQEPVIYARDAVGALDEVKQILAAEEITVRADGRFWKLNSDQFASWLEFQLVAGAVAVGVNRDKVVTFLEPVAAAVDVEAQDAKFQLSGKRVTEFQASRDGKELDVEASYQKINEAIRLGAGGEVELVVAVAPAKVATKDLNDLGITELVGRGTSNFAGSPTNRRHNISIGAGAVNGILIEPGEEFSLLKTLGEIDAANGYRPELVIKGDRTIPEYGGGLCQIGTTTFRAALAAGVPITARRNHSYRVGYYEPPVGMDATIYDPWPDFKFINDYQNHLLFITRIEGNQAVFELYGTKDGRSVATTEPVVYNIVSPGEPRIIYTDELEPGVRRKVESAHAGAEADFTYTVTYLNGEVKEEVFHSRYVPWKETWLEGRVPTTTDELVEPAEVQ